MVPTSSFSFLFILTKRPTAERKKNRACAKKKVIPDLVVAEFNLKKKKRKTNDKLIHRRFLKFYRDMKIKKFHLATAQE